MRGRLHVQAGIDVTLDPEPHVVAEGSDRFGRAFELFLINEIRAFTEYRGLDRPLRFWRTSSGFEVDIIVGDMELALEIKASREVLISDLKGLRALREEGPVRRAVVVSREPRPRKTEDGIEVLPWQDFCRGLWDGAWIE